MSNELKTLSSQILVSMVAGSQLNMTYKSTKVLDEMVEAAFYLAGQLLKSTAVEEAKSESFKDEAQGFQFRPRADDSGEKFEAQLNSPANDIALHSGFQLRPRSNWPKTDGDK